MSKTIVITGCSTGFGRQLSEQMARKGDRVYATMRGTTGKNAESVRELKAMVEAENLELSILEMDVTSTSSVNAAADEVLKKSGAPDVVINNAGQLFGGVTEAFSAKELNRQLDINVTGIHRVSRAFLPAMRKSGQGLIINVGSVAGRVAMPFFGIYHASKWAVEGYTMSLRAELASSGVDVVLVEPGPFSTALFPNTIHPEDDQGRVESYPAEVRETFEQMGTAFGEIIENSEMPTDPGLVVDRIAELTDMSAGTRPFRNVVGLDFGVTALNAAAEPFETGLLDNMGLSSFATIAPH